MRRKSVLLAIIVIFLASFMLDSASASSANCWQYDGNYSGCAAQTDDCQWSASANDPWCPYKDIGDTPSSGTPIADAEDLGCCTTFDCWSFDGDQTTCESHSADMGCIWESGDDDPWCESVGGCCDKQGCWDGDDSQASCSTINDTLGGLCEWHDDGWCEGTQGCCDPMWCGDAGTNETKCDLLADQFDMPCDFIGGSCSDQGMAFFGGMEDCLDAGGSWDGSNCDFPDMSGSFTHCWFADEQPTVCGNVTGCVYCTDNRALITSQGGYGNISDANSFCYNKPAGWCEGHQYDSNINNAGNVPTEYTDGFIANDSIDCLDITLKKTCNFGPVPFCKWNSTSEINGTFCMQGFLSESEKESLKPTVNGVIVDMCDDPEIDTEVKCAQLKDEYLMPCYWNNKNTTWEEDDECEFDWDSVAFGGEKGDIDFYDIQDEGICLLAGGSWVQETVCGSGSDVDTYGSVNTMYWCEPNTGAGSEDCDDACWACDTQLECVGSGLGYCAWDGSECDEPEVFKFEGGDCYDNCEYCNYFPNATKKSQMCDQSPAGCQWEIDPYSNEGFCMSDKKSGCSTDCFSCWEENTCQSSSAGCEWDGSNYYCTPSDYDSDMEICFDGQDNDGDGMIDCADSQCFSDSFCGGFMMGDCWSQSTNATCIATDSPIPGEKCIWGINDWDDSYHCDMPGWDCWKYEESNTTCNAASGCVWDDAPEGEVFCGINESLADLCFDAQNTTACNGLANCEWQNNSWMMGGDFEEDDWCTTQGGWCDPNPAYNQFNQPSWNWTTDWWMYCSSYDSSGEAVCDALAGSQSEGNDTDNDSPCLWIEAGQCNTDAETNGWCEFTPFVTCNQLTGNGVTSDNQATCAAAGCIWATDWGDPQYGFCDPPCFNDSITTVQECTNAGSYCEARTGWCEPEHFMGGCVENDGNQTACLEMNGTCVWYSDANGPSDGGGEPNGYCDPKMHNLVFAGVVDDAEMLGTDAASDALPASIDITGFGVKDIGDALMFGAEVSDINNTAYCNGYYIPSVGAQGAGLDESKFFWYFDTDETTSGGCSAPYTTLGNDLVSKTGFEFMVKQVAKYESNAVADTLTFYKCDATNGVWAMTNIPLYSDKPKICGTIEVIGFAIQKEDWKAFSEYDKTNDMRIFLTSGNETATRNSPSDYMDEGYYTPGSLDFGFECCGCPEGTDADNDGVPVESDSDCQDFKQYGYVPMEDCFSVADDDDDGLVNCADADCYYHPVCEGAQTYDPTTDTKAPKLVWHEAEVFDKGAFIKFDSDKPANGTIKFYYNDTTCNSINDTLYDVGILDTNIEAYKNWHDVSIDNFAFNPQNLGYDLELDTAYAYKIKMCGLNDKCSTSKCLNFTTAKSTDFADCQKCNPVMNFDFNAPAGAGSTDPFGDMQFAFKWPGENDYEIQPDFCGIQKDWSNLSSVDWKIENPTASDDWSIELVNASLATLSDDEKTLNGSAMKFEEKTSGTYVGMTTAQWNEKVGKSSPKYIKIEFPKPTDGCDALWKCDEAVTDCVDLTAKDGVTLINTTATSCIWQVPGDLGFSVYGPADAPSEEEETPGSGSSGGGGGGGGAGGGSSLIYSVTPEQFEEGATRYMNVNSGVRFIVDDVSYVFTLKFASSTRIIVNFSTSNSDTIPLFGEEKLDANSDGSYDLKVRFDDYNSTTEKATIHVVSYYEVYASAPVEEESEVAEAVVQEETSASPTTGGAVADGGSKGNKKTILYAVLILVIATVAGTVLLRKKGKKAKGHPDFGFDSNRTHHPAHHSNHQPNQYPHPKHRE